MKKVKFILLINLLLVFFYANNSKAESKIEIKSEEKEKKIPSSLSNDVEEKSSTENIVKLEENSVKKEVAEENSNNNKFYIDLHSISGNVSNSSYENRNSPEKETDEKKSANLKVLEKSNE